MPWVLDYSKNTFPHVLSFSLFLRVKTRVAHGSCLSWPKAMPKLSITG